MIEDEDLHDRDEDDQKKIIFELCIYSNWKYYVWMELNTNKKLNSFGCLNSAK